MYRYNKEKLDFEKVNLYPKVTKGLAIVTGIVLLFGFTIVPKAVVTDLSQEDKLIVIREYNEFSESQLIKKISQLNFRYPHIILAQSYQETGHYKSSIFLENHNLFGMKQAQVRSTLAKGTNRGHAFYEDWQDSVVDYALFYSTYLSDIKTEGEYFEYLRQNYAEDPTYVQRLRSLIQKNNLKAKFN